MNFKNLFLIVLGMGISMFFLQISIYLQNKKEKKEFLKKDKEREKMGFVLWSLLTSGEGSDSVSRMRTLEEDDNLRKICEKIYLYLPKEDIDKLLEINPEITNQAKSFMDYFEDIIEDD